MAINQAMTQKRGKIRRERGPAWHRAATREAILEAAREMIAQSGLEHTTLMRVAEKAGFAPASVYAYFVRKADLASAIVADDLSKFARAIADKFPIHESIGAESEAEIERDSADATVSHSEQPIASDQIAICELSQSEAPEDATSVGESGEAVADVELVARVIEEAEGVLPASAPIAEPTGEQAVETPDARMPAPTALADFEARLQQLEARRVDAWLERRLREFERMLASLEERSNAADHSTAIAGIQERVQALFDRLEAFGAKHAAESEEQTKSLARDLDSRDVRQRQAWSELRTLILDTSGRIDVLERERAARALAAEMPALAPAEPEKVEAALPKDDASSAADESYLAAARRAALTAQSLAQSEQDAANSIGLGIRGRQRAFVICGAALFVALTGAAYLLRAHQASTSPAGSAQSRHATLQAQDDMFSAPTKKIVADLRAQTARGLSYLSDSSGSNDVLAGAKLLEGAASKGEPVAEYWLATLFEHGRGETVDAVRALHWYEAAAMQGNLKAMYKLAVSYAEGTGTHKNYSEAARWFSRAAERGFVNAQYNLGVLYERGMGVPQSLLDAYKWYALAAAQGDADSRSRIDALSSQLSAEDLATARAAVSAFKAEPADADANAVSRAPATSLTHS